jgi:hypothetical protein
VIAVVSGDGFDQGLEGHGAAFGMGEGFREGVGGEGGDEVDVPVAERGEGGEGGVGIEVGVGARPGVLIEGLDGVAVGGLGLAEAESESDLDVGEVAEDFGGGPFAGSGGAGESGGTELMSEGREFAGGGADESERVGVDEAGVRVRFHRKHCSENALGKICVGI